MKRSYRYYYPETEAGRPKTTTSSNVGTGLCHAWGKRVVSPSDNPISVWRTWIVVMRTGKPDIFYNLVDVIEGNCPDEAGALIRDKKDILTGPCSLLPSAQTRDKSSVESGADD